mgnify:CR=1 FL=1
MQSETFTTHITFSSGDTHKETTRVDQLESTITRLVHGPAARLGLINEVKIVDTMDCIVFLARDNRIIFPPQGPKAA